MTARAALLPLAPRPFPGEAPSSWLDRVAARYGLSGDGLLAALLDRPRADPVWGSSARRLDVRPWPEAERAVAAATRLRPGEVAALRLGPGARGREILWPRTAVVPWCPDCVSEAALRHGEFHLRAEWASGACAACPRHRRPLRARCPVCRDETVRPRASDGRLRLWCGQCGGCTERESEARGGPPPPDRPGGHAGSPRAVWDDGCLGLLVRLQSDLLRTARGRGPVGPWAAGGADSFVAAVRCLAHVLHHPVPTMAWTPARRRPRGPVYGGQEGWAPGDEHPDDLAGTLAVAAALLARVRGGRAARAGGPVRIAASPGDGRPDRCELAARVLLRHRDLRRHFTHAEAVHLCAAPDAVLREVDPDGRVRETPASLPAGFVDHCLACAPTDVGPSRREGAEVLAPGDLAHGARAEQVAQ